MGVRRLSIRGVKRSLRVRVMMGVLLPGIALAYPYGPPDGKTGAPGEGTCHDCHTDFALNSGDGSFVIVAPSTFAPQGTYQITVTISDPNQSRWGFEFTPLSQGTCTITNPDSTQISITGSNTYVKQTTAGTNAGSPGPTSWRFNWNAPSSPSDTVYFYAAGNGANNNGRSSGDYIYTAVTYSVQDAQPPNPINDLSIVASGVDLILNWSNPGDNVGVVDYLVYSSPVAFFLPAGPSFQVVSGPTFTVANGAGDPSVNHFYNVLARDAAQSVGPPSNYVGEVEFGSAP